MTVPNTFIAGTKILSSEVNANFTYLDNFVTGATAFTTININGGAIDGTPIGANTASTLRGTTLSLTSTNNVLSNLIPSTSATYDLGSSTNVWDQLWASRVGNNLVTFDTTNARVGILNTTPTEALDVTGDIRLVGIDPELIVYSTVTGNRRLIIKCDTTNSKNIINSTYGSTGLLPIVFQFAGTDRITFSTTGTIKTPQTYSTTVGGTNRALYVDNTGLIGYVVSRAGAKNSVLTLSDEEGLFDKLNALRPVSFYYNNDMSGQRRYGLIAEEVDAVNPHWVSYDEVYETNEETGEQTPTGELIPATVNYNELIAVLIAGYQHLQARIAVLEGA